MSLADICHLVIAHWRSTSHVLGVGTWRMQRGNPGERYRAWARGGEGSKEMLEGFRDGG